MYLQIVYFKLYFFPDTILLSGAAGYMKILIKILSIIFGLFFAALLIELQFSIFQEIDIFKYEIESNADIIKKEILHIINRYNGSIEEVQSIIKLLNAGNTDYHIELTTAGKFYNSQLFAAAEPEYQENILKGGQVNTYDFKFRSGKYYSFIPLNANNTPLLIIISGSMERIYTYLKKAIIRSISVSVILLVIIFLFIIFYGMKYISSPLTVLINKTKRIGRGDFSIDHLLKGNDEFKQLEDAVNAMCRDLAGFKNTIKQENENRIKLLEQLRHSERLTTVGQLASGIAHELGTPLNVIFGRSQLIIAEELTPDEVNKYSKIIIEQTEYMKNIIRQLLDFARPEKTKREKIELDTLIKQIISILSPSAGKNNINFIVNKELKGNILINVDEVQIKQVLINIIVNSIQAMPEGGDILINYGIKKLFSKNENKKEKHKHLIISISDTGPGISPDALTYIFDPFFTTKKIGRGTGLGLSVAYGIINEHKGWIEVESELNKGCTFSIFIPVD